MLLFGAITKNLHKIAILATILLYICITRTSAASFFFEPSSRDFVQGCSNTVNLMIDASGDISNAADVEVEYDSNDIEIEDIIVNPSDSAYAYQMYFAEEINSNNFKLAGASFSNELNSRKIFATIRFRSKGSYTNSGASETTFRIKFDGIGATLDSNIAESSTSDDLLTLVGNATYTFSNPPEFGSCQTDTEAPNINFVYPTNNQTGVPQNAIFQLRITDNISGVDLTTLRIIFNGITYTVNSPEVSYTQNGSNRDYSITINPLDSLILLDSTDTSNSLRVEVSDFKGNAANRTITFNRLTPIPTPCPSVLPTTTPSPSGTPIPGTSPTGSPQVSQTPAPSNTTQTPGASPTFCIPTSDILNLPTPTPGLPRSETCDTCPANFVSTTGKIVDNIPGINQIPLVENLSDEEKTGLAIISVLSMLGLLQLLPYLRTADKLSLILDIFRLFFESHDRTSWGIVTDLTTGEPIKFAICKLYTAKTTNLVEQTLTDKSGKYYFQEGDGSYRLEIFKDGYERFNLDLNVKEGISSFDGNVKLISTGIVQSEQTNSRYHMLKDLVFQYLRLIIKRIENVFFIFGLGFTIYELFFERTPLNIAMLLVYIIVMIVRIRLEHEIRIKHSSVLDSHTDLRIPNALIQVVSPQDGKVMDNLITDHNGRFDYWGQPGEYLVNVTSKGYTFPSSESHDLQITEFRNKKYVKIRLSKGNNKLNIYVDPEK